MVCSDTQSVAEASVCCPRWLWPPAPFLGRQVPFPVTVSLVDPQACIPFSPGDVLLRVGLEKLPNLSGFSPGRAAPNISSTCGGCWSLGGREGAMSQATGLRCPPPQRARGWREATGVQGRPLSPHPSHTFKAPPQPRPLPKVT